MHPHRRIISRSARAIAHLIAVAAACFITVAANPAVAFDYIIDDTTFYPVPDLDKPAKGVSTRQRRKPSNAAIVRRRRSKRYGQLRLK